MSDYIRITIPILKDDFFILRDDATKHYRDTRQHAAWLLRQALSAGGEPLTTDKTQNDGGPILQDAATAVPS